MATTACALAAAPVALGHGGPVSQALSRGPLFVSPALAPPADALTRLRTVLRRARARGFEIRVALLASRGDVGDEATLWGKPGAYARVLSAELAARYQGPLLVVMPAGVGIATNGRTSARAAVVSDLRVHNGPSGLVDDAVTAVARVAAVSGHPIRVPPKTNTSTSSADRLTIVAAALALAALFAAFRLRTRDARAPRSIEEP